MSPNGRSPARRFGVVICITALVVAFIVYVLGSNRSQIGGPESLPDTGRMDDRFPDTLEWVKAGVEGGIPLREEVPVRVTIAPGDDIQEAINGVAKSGYGVVLLTPGWYPITKCIQMQTGVVLRGKDREKCVIAVTMRPKERSDWKTYGIVMFQNQWAGIEDLTIVHPGVSQMSSKVYNQVYGNDSLGTNDLYVGHVAIVGCSNCWIDNCRLLYAGTNPLQIWRCEHITSRDNLVSVSFNKGDNLNGYYVLKNSKYVLCCNETVLGLRHFSIQGNGSKFNVVLNCYFETDINFHGLDDGHNLIQGCLVQLPKNHAWTPIASYITPRGAGNILYQMDVFDKQGMSFYVRYHDFKINDMIRIPCEPKSMFEISRTNAPLVCKMDMSPPKTKTLYAVTGTCKPATVLRKLYGTIRMK